MGESIGQILPEFLFRPVEGPADSAFVHPSGSGDGGNGLLLKIKSHDGLPLQIRQLLPDHLPEPFQLNFPGQPGAEKSFKPCISGLCYAQFNPWAGSFHRTLSKDPV